MIKVDKVAEVNVGIQKLPEENISMKQMNWKQQNKIGKRAEKGRESMEGTKRNGWRIDCHRKERAKRKRKHE